MPGQALPNDVIWLGVFAPQQPYLIAQALALKNGVGLEISRALIHAKLEGQERLVRERLKDSGSADVIAGLWAKLAGADRVEVIRVLEAHAAIAYLWL
jgi:CRISPR/Cas system-associated endonuclease Cas1